VLVKKLDVICDSFRIVSVFLFFLRDDPQATMFAINFFTSIGLGGLTEELRSHFKVNTISRCGVPSVRKRLFEKLKQF
jgi:hypothetical protein